jgi:hypothetical protein
MTGRLGELLDTADGDAAAGRGAAAVAGYAAAVDLALAGDDVPAAVRAAVALARGHRFDSTPGLLPARLHEVFVRAGEPADRARLAAALARTWAYSGQPQRAVPFADTALSLAHSIGDPVLLADCLDATLAAHWGPDDLEFRRRCARELDETAAHLREPRARTQSHLWGLITATEALDLHRMHRHLRALELLGEQDPEARFFAASRRLAVDLMRGRCDTAPYLRQVAADAARQALIADGENVLHAMTAYPAILGGDRAACAAEAEAFEDYGLSEGSPVVLAEGSWVWVGAGRPDRAEVLLGHFAGDTLDGLPRDVNWLLTVQCVLEAALATGYREVIAKAVELLTPYEGRAVVNAGAVMFHGVTDDTLARGHALLGHAEAATRLRAQALATYRRIGATWWRERLEAWTSGAPRPFHPADGGLWLVGEVTLPALRGLEYLHRLLSRPGAALGVLDLVGPTVDQGDAGPLADRQALAAYRKRLDDIATQLDRPGLSAAASCRLDDERAAILDHLRATTGLGDRLRSGGSSAERARVAVRKAIVGALARIAETDPVLGRHLHDRVTTGSECRYDPDPEQPITWILS